MMATVLALAIKLLKDLFLLIQEYHQFVTNKNMIEQEKKNKLDKSVDQMYEQLLKWNKERKWTTDISRKLISDPKDHEALITKLCREETEKAYYAGPKGKALQLSCNALPLGPA